MRRWEPIDRPPGRRGKCTGGGDLCGPASAGGGVGGGGPTPPPPVRRGNCTGEGFLCGPASGEGGAAPADAPPRVRRKEPGDERNDHAVSPGRRGGKGRVAHREPRCRAAAR